MAVAAPQATPKDVAPPPDRTGGIALIIVPIDGSDLARAALAPAAYIAREVGATVVLVQAATPAHVPGIDPDLQLRLGESDAAASLREAAASQELAGLPVHRVLVRGALAESAADAILRVTRESGADLIVMATHGRTGLARAVLGSVADAVVAASPVPVLLVRPRPGRDSPAGWIPPAGEPPRLLVALDGTHAAEAALAPAAALASGLGAEVELVRVLRVASRLPDADRPSIDAATTVYLEAAARRLHASGIPMEHLHTTVLPRDRRDVADTLLAHAAQTHAAMLVIATRARRGLDRLLHGSVEANAVARAPLPILAVRAPAGRRPTDTAPDARRA